MAKLPSWMKIEQYKTERNNLVIVIRIRRWHPGWWLEYWTIAYQSAKECHAPLHHWLPVALSRFFFIGREELGDGVVIDHE